VGLVVHHAIRGRVIAHLQAANASFRGRVPPPCPQLAAYRLSSRPLRFLRRCLRVRLLGRHEIRRDPRELALRGRVPVPHLPPLRLPLLRRRLLPLPRYHARLRLRGPGHQIVVDVDRIELFCAACGDQVYDPDFDHAVFLA
jgi:ubiquitin carboxyl-terminal hydrolase 22/27/51